MNIAKKLSIIVSSILISSLIILPLDVSAKEPVSIVMEKTTYSYCEKLFYTIIVSEIVEDTAIIHIRDESGKGSSAVPIQITSLENPIDSLIPFDKNIFPLGKYYVDVEYAGNKDTIEFELIDSNKICVPVIMRPIIVNWIEGNISDGFLMDAFGKYSSTIISDTPFEINQDNVYQINIPVWLKNVGIWWSQEIISDKDFINIINYLVENNVITEGMETDKLT